MIDQFFTSKAKCNGAGYPLRESEKPEDIAERDRLFALPFKEQRAEYNRIWELRKAGISVPRGQFLFITNIDRKRHFKLRGIDRFSDNYKKYCTGNITGGAFSSGRNVEGRTNWNKGRHVQKIDRHINAGKSPNVKMLKNLHP